MTIYIDQSGKVEDTATDTVLACTNGKSYTISLTTKNKRRIQESLRRRGIGKMFMIYTFASLLYLLIKKARIKSQTIFVDIEYPGHSKTIEDIISKLNKNPIDIRWKLVGKSSLAHELAIQTKRGKKKANVKTGAEELLKLILAAGRFSSAT